MLTTLRACKLHALLPFGTASSHSSNAAPRTRHKQRWTVKNQQDDSSGAAQGRPNALTVTVKRKQKQIADLLQELGLETLEERLQSATSSPARPPHRFLQLIQVPGDTPLQATVMRHISHHIAVSLVLSSFGPSSKMQSISINC